MEPLDADRARWREDGARALLLILGLILGLFLVVRSATQQITLITSDAALASLLGVFLVAAAWIRGALLSERTQRMPESLCLALCLWVGLQVLGALRSPYAGAAVPLLMNGLLFALLVAAGFYLAGGCQAALRWLLGALAGLGAVEAFYGLWLKFVQLPRLRLETSSGQVVLPDEMASQLARERIGSEEIFGTFEIANSYACFLLLTIFAQLGLWMESRRRRPAGAGAVQPMDLAHLALLTLQLWAFWLSGSKGGYVALALGVWFLGIQRFATTSQRKKILQGLTVAGLAILVGALVLGIAGAVNLNLIGGSISVRLEYWRTAWKMLSESADHLFLGVGLGGFGELYCFYKTPLATEVKETHNDWLQLWVELGVLGSLAWAALWYVVLRPRAAHATSTETPAVEEPAEQRRGRWFVLAGAACGFAILFVALDGFTSADLWAFLGGEATSNAMRGAAATLVIPVLFAGVYFLHARNPHAHAPTGNELIWCARAAIGSVLVHQLVDFPMRVPAVMSTLALLAGMLAAERLRGEPAAPNQSRLLQRLADWSVPLMAVALLPGIFCVLLNSGCARRAAEDDLNEYRELSAKARRGAPITPEAAQQLNQLLASSVRNNENAYAWAPFDGAAAFEIAMAYIALESRKIEKWQPDPNKRDERQLWELAAERLDDARRLRPYWPAAPAMAGHQALQLGVQRLRAHDTSAAASFFEKALWNYRQAARLYPLAPGLQMLVGDALLFLNRPHEASKAYVQAWETDKKIFDPNVRFSAIFHDPQPGCLARHEMDLEVLQLTEAALAGLKQDPSPDALGLHLRKVLALAWARARVTATGADADRLKRMRESQLEACQQLQKSAPGDGHAALFAAAAQTLVDPAAGQAAWDQAMNILQEQREKGEAATVGATVANLRWILKLK